MHKIIYMAPVESMSGKFAKESTKISRGTESYPVTNPRGIQYFIATYRLGTGTKSFAFKNRSQSNAPTSAQQAAVTKFTSTIAAVKAARTNPTQWQTIVAAFKKQTKYKTLNGFAFYYLYNQD